MAESHWSQGATTPSTLLRARPGRSSAGAPPCTLWCSQLVGHRADKYWEVGLSSVKIADEKRVFYRDLRYNNRRSGHSTPVINESGFGVLMMPSESFRELAVWGRWIAIAFGTWCA